MSSNKSSLQSQLLFLFSSLNEAFASFILRTYYCVILNTIFVVPVSSRSTLTSKAYLSDRYTNQ